jgi:hypothetical protein
MGYYTRYSLVISGPANKAPEEIISELREISYGAKYALEDSGDTREFAKWYDNDEDLRDFSKRYPDILFELHVEGEESEDIWKLYVQNGKSQRCEAIISFEPFDKDKLK